MPRVPQPLWEWLFREVQHERNVQAMCCVDTLLNGLTEHAERSARKAKLAQELMTMVCEVA